MVSTVYNPAVVSRIYSLGIQNQILMKRTLDLHLVPESKQCKYLDSALLSLLYKATSFDFIGQIPH